MGGVPLAHLFILCQSTSSTGIFCKKSSRILVQGKNIVVKDSHIIKPSALCYGLNCSLAVCDRSG